ncbi:MAG: ribosome small subunit-dependent GTPase A [Candidatus Gastranaerophilales bacterium]|nr:ribosome small subunit-dependent GTPase A [Candidatus Gastranaerophilales bacterium]
MQKGQIFKIHSDFYYVEASGETYECKLREVIKKQKQKVYVGDFVEFENGAIVKILPRENFITRPTVANVDQVIIISAVKEPELSFLQLNRYIAFAKYHNLKTVLCFNKNDLSDDDKTIEKVFSIYEPLGFDILFTSALEGFGLDEFREILKGKTSVLCGSSGVGKSSLINAVSGVNLRTKEVSEKTGRGTHTTRHSEIITIAEDTRIVDTPGFSNLKFDFLLPHDVDTLFSEIHPYKEHCKFQDCLHINETDCAVKAHLGEIDMTRYESYIAFVEEAKEYKEKVKYQGVKTESTHKQTHSKTAVKISSRKRQSARNTQKQNIYKDIDHEELD